MSIPLKRVQKFLPNGNVNASKSVRKLSHDTRQLDVYFLIKLSPEVSFPNQLEITSPFTFQSRSAPNVDFPYFSARGELELKWKIIVQTIYFVKCDSDRMKLRTFDVKANWKVSIEKQMQMDLGEPNAKCRGNFRIEIDWLKFTTTSLQVRTFEQVQDSLLDGTLVIGSCSRYVTQSCEICQYWHLPATHP